jgi:hypothetical protein
MATICAYQFVLRPLKGQSSRDCLDASRDEIADWICDIYRSVGMQGVAIPFDGTCLSPHPSHELWSEQRECTTHRLATLEWVWPEGNDPSLSWSFSAAAACDEEAVEVALVIQIVSRPFLLRPSHYAMTPNNPLSFVPALVKRLLHLWPGEIAGWPIPTQYRALRVNTIDRFVRETLRHPARVLPVVIVNLTGPVNVKENGLQGAQDRLLGLAHVAALINKSAVERLMKVLGNESSWEGCPARVFWPLLPGDPGGPHLQFDEAEIRRELQRYSLDQVLLKKFVEYNAERFREGERIRAARLAVDREQSAWRQAARTAESELNGLQAELRQMREERDRLRQECDTARQLVLSQQSTRPQSFDEFAAEVERAWDENRRLTTEIEKERQQLEELREELRIHQENWSYFASSGAAAIRPSEVMPPRERSFADAADALRAAAEDFADVLLVWDDAYRSAEASLFRTPPKVYRALQAIAEVGRAYFQARDGGAPLGPVERAFACRVPFKYTGFESQTTLHLHGDERVFHHHNDSRQMQRHLTLGGGDTNNCLQIYFDFDDVAQRVLIGYCGRHLPFYRQRT